MRALKEQWEAQILTANAFFGEGKYAAALPGYEAALHHAEALNASMNKLRSAWRWASRSCRCTSLRVIISPTRGWS